MEEVQAFLNQLLSKNKKIYLLGLSVLFLITNPSLDVHKNEVIFNMKPMSLESREFYRSRISRMNFLLLSFTRFKDFDNTSTYDSRQIVGVGFLGQVYIFNDALE